MQALNIDGVSRDLSHLDSFVVTLDGKGRDGADLRVLVHLGLHTISRACRAGETANMCDEQDRPRIFCEDRYAYSLGLKEISTRMILEKYFCWESKDRNRVMNYAIVDIAPGRMAQQQDGEHQVIFFYLHPADGNLADVNLHITSCYRRHQQFSSKARRYDTHYLLRKCLFQNTRLP